MRDKKVVGVFIAFYLLHMAAAAFIWLQSFLPAAAASRGISLTCVCDL
jgi:hypothetical protein